MYARVNGAVSDERGCRLALPPLLPQSPPLLLPLPPRLPLLLLLLLPPPPPLRLARVRAVCVVGRGVLMSLLCSDGARLVATPAARRVAGERGIDLSSVEGTGPDRRIVRADVEEFKGANQSRVLCFDRVRC